MTQTFFKATRPDGTSFHDATTMWEVGRVTRLPARETPGDRLCGRGVLHAATVETETLAGGSWPCRLFTVEPVGDLVVSAAHPRKVGCHAWKVTGELEPWRVFGPQGRLVVRLVDQAGSLTLKQAQRIDAARDAAWSATRSAAWSAALDAAWDAAWAAARDAAWAAADALKTTTEKLQGSAADLVRRMCELGAEGGAR